MLASRLGSFEGLRVADLFAGSGALGLEALSRGAAHCLFVENDRSALHVLNRNISSLGAGDCAGGGARAVNLPPPPSVLFFFFLMPPPYRTGLAQMALDRIA